MDQAAPGFVMRGPDREVWVRADDRAAWESRGFTIVEARASRVEAGPPPPPETPAPAAVDGLGWVEGMAAAGGYIEYTALPLVELRTRAREAGIEGASRMNKAQLMAALEAASTTVTAEVTEADGGWPAEG